MAQPSSAALATPLISVIGPQFCVPDHPIDLVVVRKLLALTLGNFAVTDVNENILFNLKVRFTGFHDRRLLTDAAGNPIVTFQQKLRTAHCRWQVFKGDSHEDADLIFTAKTPSMFQLKTNLNVYLANNTAEEVCDFKVEGSWLERSCVIYAGESSTNIIAQMHKKLSVGSVLIAKDKFMVTVYPNVDYAFIVALIVILDDINKDNGGF